jgi:hypothetical protein
MPKNFELPWEISTRRRRLLRRLTLNTPFPPLLIFITPSFVDSSHSHTSYSTQHEYQHKQH